MTHEREPSHDHAADSPAPQRDDLDPGRTSRTAHLRKPEHAQPSGLVQRAARDANGVVENAGDAVAAAASSTGAPLPATLQRKFEASLGSDLAAVRVHAGEASATAADAVGAKAYTVGHDIHFGAGHYDPSSTAGEHLLAHEVAHTVQQGGGAQRVQFKLAVSAPADALEIEADRAADAMVSGAPATITSAERTVQREAKSEPSVTVGPVTAVNALPGVERVKHAHQLVTTTQKLVGMTQKGAGDMLQSAYALQQKLVARHVKQYNVELAAIESKYALSAEKAKLAHEKAELLQHEKHHCEYALKFAVAGVDLLAHGLGPASAGVALIFDVAATLVVDAAIKVPRPPPPPDFPIPKLEFLGEDLAASTAMAQGFHALTGLGDLSPKLMAADEVLFELYGKTSKSSSSLTPGQLSSLDRLAVHCGTLQNALDAVWNGAEKTLAETKARLAADVKIDNTKTKETRASELVGKMVEIVTITADVETRNMSGTVRADTGEVFRASFHNFFRLQGPKYVPDYPAGSQKVTGVFGAELSIMNPFKYPYEPNLDGTYPK